MIKDFVQIYEKTFKTSEIDFENLIIKKILHFKNKKVAFVEASNKILLDFNEMKNGSWVFNDKYGNLNYLFKNRLSKFEDGFEMNIITEYLLPEFNNLIPSDPSKTFEEFIIEFAKINASEFVLSRFQINKNTYEFMYKLNDFSEIKIIGFEGGENSILHEKYRSKIYGKINHNISFQPNLLIEIGKIAQKNNFAEKEKSSQKIKKIKIKEEFEEKFYSEEFYDHLCEIYFLKDQSSFKDFKIIFLNKSENNLGKIKFKCSTKLGSKLLESFVKNIFNNLTYTQIVKNEIYTNEDTKLTRSNISNSISNCSESEENKVKKTLDFLKSVNISIEKC